ncbi:hypothetical protein [Amycolatopsis aidingensis]|uniref:hypothetical protein n=1 Tax=Amycolatopsis aidingensis TaxID=2842453 RepID=UPI001C0AF6A5|nr:hypothetical protein [Amycolatopsis aidingensis]
MSQGAEPVFDKRDQYEQVVSGLLDGERVLAVYDAIGAGTGFIGHAHNVILWHLTR